MADDKDPWDNAAQDPWEEASQDPWESGASNAIPSIELTKPPIQMDRGEAALRHGPNGGGLSPKRLRGGKSFC